MQEKDTVLEVKNLYKLFGPYDFLGERKAAFNAVGTWSQPDGRYGNDRYHGCDQRCFLQRQKR